MDIYNLNHTLTGRYLMCDLQNCILIRQDLQTVFDSKAFVLVPKMGTMYLHFLKYGPNYAPMFHNSTAVKMDIAAEFLYARFAWAVLPLVMSFASRPEVRIKVFNPHIADWEITTAGEFHHKQANQSTHKRRRGIGGIDNTRLPEGAAGYMNHRSQRMRTSDYPSSSCPPALTAFLPTDQVSQTDSASHTAGSSLHPLLFIGQGTYSTTGSQGPPGYHVR